MKSTVGLIAAGAAIVILLVFLSASAKKPPFIPSDSMHSGSTTAEACVACHAPGRRAPLRANHPPKEQCFICHKIKKT